MSENEKSTLEHFLKSLSKVGDTQKEYLLGLADGIALMADGREESDQKAKQTKQV